MKKILIGFFAIVFTLGLSLGLIACEEKPHVHEYVPHVTQPTCSQRGYTTSICECGKSHISAQTPALGHTYEGGICLGCKKRSPSEGLKMTRRSDGTSYAVTGLGSCTDLELVIPETHNGFPVKEIAGDAFKFYGLTSIDFGDSVVSIGNAFWECRGLRSVVIGANVTSISDDAFYTCSNLATVYYKGTKEDWNRLGLVGFDNYLTKATRYYYVERIEDVPTDGKFYWHYQNGAPVLW